MIKNGLLSIDPSVDYQMFNNVFSQNHVKEIIDFLENYVLVSKLANDRVTYNLFFRIETMDKREEFKNKRMFRVIIGDIDGYIEHIMLDIYIFDTNEIKLWICFTDADFKKKKNAYKGELKKHNLKWSYELLQYIYRNQYEFFINDNHLKSVQNIFNTFKKYL